MDDFWYFYNPGDKAREIDCSPLLATEFKDFPPTYVSVAGCDPLRDQGWAYAKKLEDAGVALKFDVMGGYPHGMSGSKVRANVQDITIGRNSQPGGKRRRICFLLGSIGP